MLSDASIKAACKYANRELPGLSELLFHGEDDLTEVKLQDLTTGIKL